MRFEIRAGGALLILVGLAGLSGVVFALGLYAGYEIARQTAPESAQMASVYPVPSAPPASEPSAAPSPAAAMTASAPAEPAVSKPAPEKPAVAAGPAAAPSTSIAESTAPPPAPAKAPVAKANAPAAAPSRSNAAAAATRREETSDDSAEEPANAAAAAPGSGPKYASASVPTPPRHKPFNIQIDAAMDRANAEQMASRLQKLGYHAFLVPTDIDGQTWWRVRVGPYNSAEEAQAAEQELRARYRTAYASH